MMARYHRNMAQTPYMMNVFFPRKLPVDAERVITNLHFARKYLEGYGIFCTQQ